LSCAAMPRYECTPAAIHHPMPNRSIAGRSATREVHCGSTVVIEKDRQGSGQIHSPSDCRAIQAATQERDRRRAPQPSSSFNRRRAAEAKGSRGLRVPILRKTPQLFAAKTPMREKFTREARAAARQAIVAQADTRARSLAPVIAEIRAAGVHSYRGIAAQLNARGIPTARGGRWAATQVRDIVLRSGK
jgi:hypothetical protein